MIVEKVAISPPHLGGAGVIPPLEFRRRHLAPRLETIFQRLDQSSFGDAGAIRLDARQLDMVETSFRRPPRFGLAELLPGETVEWAGGTGDAPMDKGAVRIGLERLLETTLSLLIALDPGVLGGLAVKRTWTEGISDA